MDFVGRCRGQIKVEISPEISSQILRQKYRQRNLLVEDQQPITQSNVHKLLSPQGSLLLTSTYNSPQTTAAVKIKEAAHHPPPPSKKALWNLPEIPSLDETKDHRSILQKKLGELDIISNGLKGKLHQGREGHEPLFATAAASAPPPMPSSSSTNDLQEDLQRLRSCLETQLTQMQNTLNKGQILREIENQPETDVDPPSENQELPRPRMEPDGGNPNESKIDTTTHSVRSNSSKE